MNITSKGPVTMPQRIRNTFGLKPGTAVECVTEGDQVFIKSKSRQEDVAQDWLKDARGALKGVSADERMKLARGEKGPQNGAGFVVCGRLCQKWFWRLRSEGGFRRFG